MVGTGATVWTLKSRFIDMKNWLLPLVGLPLTLSLGLGCAKKESDDLNRAQQCLDQVPQSDPGQAQSCMQYVEKYDSQAANILKCSIQMTAGGLIENKVLQAYKALKDDSQSSKTAAFMSILSLNLPSIDEGLARAQTANQYCKSSGVNGLIYISSIIVAGTAMNSILYHLTGGAGAGQGIDLSNPASINAAVANLVTKCSGTPIDPACTASLPVIGSAVVTVSSAYCSQSDADQTVCGQIQPAIQSAGTDPTQVGQALFCYLKSKAYNASTQACQ